MHSIVCFPYKALTNKKKPPIKMVIMNGTGERTLFGPSTKVRRSRRLSSTTGLGLRNIDDTNRRDYAKPTRNINEKPSLRPTVRKNTNIEEKTRKKSSVNWELNEKISLSSSSSPSFEIRADAKNGIKLCKDLKTSGFKMSSKMDDVEGSIKSRRSSNDSSRQSLTLMNISGFPETDSKHYSPSRSTDMRSKSEFTKVAVDDENVIKSDSKYEIGVPSKQFVSRKMKKGSQISSGISKAGQPFKIAEKVMTNGDKKWIAAKKKIDKTNDSISKRLELIHELNQKILTNYEKIQQKSKRSHSKNSNELKESSKYSQKRVPESNVEKAVLDFHKEEHVKSEVSKRKNKVSDNYRVVIPRKHENTAHRRKMDPHRSTSLKNYSERFVSTGEKLEKQIPKESKSITEPRDLSVETKTFNDSNENFNLAPKQDLYFQKKPNSPVRTTKFSKGSLCSKDEKCTTTKMISSTFYVEEKIKEEKRNEEKRVEEGVEEIIVYETFHRDKEEVKEIFLEHESRFDTQKAYQPQFSTEDRNKTSESVECHKSKSQSENQVSSSIEKKPQTLLPTVPAENEKSNSLIRQKILEEEILEELNGAISKFDNNKFSDTFLSSPDDLMDSFNVDSTHSVSSVSDGDFRTGVDVEMGRGWIRIHTGIESNLVYMTLDTTVKDVCRDMLLGDDLSLFIQYGGEPGRRLALYERPLKLQDEFLQQLGYHDAFRRARLGVDPELRHLIAFHVGPGPALPGLTGYTRCGHALVLKGLVFPQWKKRPLAVIGSRLFLYPVSSDTCTEWMELGYGGAAVCFAPSRLGKLVLRVTGFPKITRHPQLSYHPEDEHCQETRHLYLGFNHSWERDLWRGWIKRATQLPACPKKLDLSKGGLLRIPDSAIAFPAIEELLLGQNQLANPDNNLSVLHRFPRLCVIHLQRNGLKTVPPELLDLRGLTSLDLSDNDIEKVPSEIVNLVNLEELILDRNVVKDLPKEVGELRHLKYISLAGNLLTTLPPFLDMRALTLTDVQCRDQSKLSKDERNHRNSLHKVNLRNNQLKGSIILGNYGNLTHLDVSENNIERLDVSAVQGLRSLRCARNVLVELTLCGKNLVSLIAGNNRLKKLTVDPIPTNLEHLDVSYNALDSLPEWISNLPLLRALFASHNALPALPDRLFSQPSRLEVLHLPHNRLQTLPPPRRPLNIVHLTLQGNALTALPTSFFANTEKLKVLNLSNNRLSELPYGNEGPRSEENSHSLEKLYLTGNCLTDTVLDTLARFTALRTLHIAYNTLDTLPESCIMSWKDLEELVLSGNRLQYLPDRVADLQHLRVLRVHSNRLLTCPTFNKTAPLRVLDLAHNQLDKVNLATLVPPQLQFLDISCNSRLHVDPRQFQAYRSQRPVSLVDVSGQNRSNLPFHPRQPGLVNIEKGLDQRWRLGFSETTGSREKLFISQVRMPAFCSVEGLFGIFDGSSNQEAPTGLQEMIPRLLLEERTVKETSKDYLKYTLLAAHRELKDKGQKYGIDASLVHITRIPAPQGYPQTSKRYSLKVVSSGEAKAVLCRAAGPLVMAPSKKAVTKNQLRHATMFPLVVPDPTMEEVFLEDDDEFVIIANKRLWEVMSVQEAIREARAEASPVLAAKRLQDLAQAYGAEDNLSVIVLRLTGPGPGDLDQLMRELRHAVSKNRGQDEGGRKCSCPCCQPPIPHKPPIHCCCHVNEGYYLNGVLKNVIDRSGNKAYNGSDKFFKNNKILENDSPLYRDDRSSPSGQSDQASDSTFKSRHPSGHTWAGSAASRTTRTRQSVLMQENGTRKISPYMPRQEDAISVRSGALSEEQFRCWEYMLEQNTQLLFDKELDTLTRSSLRKGQSRSTPQLTGNLPFLSKRFGSARTFNPGVSRTPIMRFGSGRRLLNGGPNAAYFGSLQRLMPYNLEYDFAVIQERGGLDSLEQDTSRMQQYWEVATTEL